MKILSARQICIKYPDKYIAVKVLEKDSGNEIVKAQVLKIYDAIDECKAKSEELKFLLKLHGDNFDVLFGDYEDYLNTRVCKIENAFHAMGFIALEMLGKFDLDAALEEIDKARRQ